MPQTYTYNIDGKIYHQRPLVIGQVKQLMDILGEITLPAYIDMPGIISILGDKLPSALAVILTPEGVHPKDKDIEALSDELAYAVDLETSIQAVEDFVGLNPIVSVLEKLNGTLGTIQKNMTGQTNSSVSSQEGTLHDGTQSSGDIPSENAKSTSSTEGET